MKTRERFEELLPEFVSGELSADELVEFNRLVADRPDWREEANEEKALVELMRNAPRVKAPANLLSSAKEKAGLGAAKVVEVEPRRSSRRLWNYAAAAAVLVGVIGYAGYKYISSSSSELQMAARPSAGNEMVAEISVADAAMKNSTFAPTDGTVSTGDVLRGGSREIASGDIDNDGDLAVLDSNGIPDLSPSDITVAGVPEIQLQDQSGNLKDSWDAEESREIASATVLDDDSLQQMTRRPSDVARDLRENLEKRREEGDPLYSSREIAQAPAPPSSSADQSDPFGSITNSPYSSQSRAARRDASPPAPAKKEQSEGQTLNFDQSQASAFASDATSAFGVNASSSPQSGSATITGSVGLPSREQVNRLLTENRGRVVADTPWKDTAESFLEEREMNASPNGNGQRYIVAEFDANRTPSANRPSGQDFGTFYFDNLEQEEVGSRVRMILPYTDTVASASGSTSEPERRAKPGVDMEGDTWREAGKRNRVQSRGLESSTTDSTLAKGSVATYDELHEYLVGKGGMFLYYTPNRDTAIKPMRSSETSDETESSERSAADNRLRDGYTGYLVFQFEESADAFAALNSLRDLSGAGVENIDKPFAEVLSQKSGARLVIPYKMVHP